MKKRKNDPLEEIMSNPYYQLRDDYNYAEKVKGTISFGQYSMKYWALERDIVLDETKSEVTEEMFVKAIMDARKEGEILNDEDEVNGARKIRRKVISHLNIIFHKNLTHLTHPTQDEAYLKKLQLYIIFVERPVSSLILSTGLYFLLENGGKTMADVMVKILMKGAKAIGKTAVILIIWIAHKLENK